MKISPITKKRIQRFTKKKRALWSFYILVALLIVSLCSNMIANNKPLYVKYEGRSYFPFLKFYSESTFTGSGNESRADYKKLNASSIFHGNPDNYMIFPIVSYGPYEILLPGDLDVPKRFEVEISKELNIASINVSLDGEIVRSRNAEYFCGVDDRELKGNNISNFWELGSDFYDAVSNRFANIDSPLFRAEVDYLASFEGRDVYKDGVDLTLSTYRERSRPIRYSKITVRERDEYSHNMVVSFDTNGVPVSGGADVFSDEILSDVSERISNFSGEEDVFLFSYDGNRYRASISKVTINWPYAPCNGHIMGIDAAGRDVFARVLYALRTSLLFGITLVFISMVIGVVAGSLQGYYGGWVDISFQRFTEIWSALPFLYIMILLGSILGRGLGLFIICYGIFNWIGISYYMRGEYLRLRNTAFVDSARCLGLPTRTIIFKHILPNALTPVITFFPFSLVGAISSLAALDYLGFGLPPPTPSWGELLQQAQAYRWAWWLIFYPSAALFSVILLSVFIGEGLRDAFDPKSFSRIK